MTRTKLTGRTPISNLRGRDTFKVIRAQMDDGHLQLTFKVPDLGVSVTPGPVRRVRAQ